MLIPEMKDEPAEGGDPIYFPEKWPQYHGGDLSSFRNHIQSIVEYPDEAIRMGLEGKVFVQFVVNQKGEEVISERHQKDFKKESFFSDEEDTVATPSTESFTNVSFEDI